MNISAEQTISHISAIITPIIGGTVWVMFGSQTPFLVEVLIALVSPVLAQAIRTPAEPVAAIVPTGV